jgi:hypothetical protein
MTGRVAFEIISTSTSTPHLPYPNGRVGIEPTEIIADDEQTEEQTLPEIREFRERAARENGITKAAIGHFLFSLRFHSVSGAERWCSMH